MRLLYVHVVIDIVRLALLSTIGQKHFIPDHNTGAHFVKKLITLAAYVT